MKKFIAFFLAILMAVITPFQVLAAGENSANNAKQYVKELFLVRKDQLSHYQNNGDYMVYANPLYKNKNPDDNASTELYLVALLTADPAEAITDIKALQMGDTFSFDEYKQLLKNLRAIAAIQAKIWLAGAIPTFREMYEAGKESAISAYQLLNCFFDDSESFKATNNGDVMFLGDLFLSDKLTEDIIANIILTGNTDAVDVIRKALAIACSVDENDKTFLDYIGNKNYAQKVAGGSLGKLEDYANDAQRLLESINDKSEYSKALKIYKKYKTQYEEAAANGEKALAEFDDMLIKSDYGDNGDAEQVLQNYLESHVKNEYELFYKGKEYTKLFGSISFYALGIPGTNTKDSNHITLLDLFNKTNYYPKRYNGTKGDPDDLLLKNLEYFVIAAKDMGAEVMLDLGLVDLISIAASDKTEYQTRINELKTKKDTDEDKEVAKYANEGISVYYGVDSNIFVDGMVAMTGSARDENAHGNSSWVVKQAEYIETAKKAKNAYMYMCIGSGSAAAVSLGCLAKYISYAVSRNYGTVFKLYTKALGKSSYLYTADKVGENIRLSTLPQQQLYKNVVNYEAGTEYFVVVDPNKVQKSSYFKYGWDEAVPPQEFMDNIPQRSATNISAGVVSGAMFVISLAVLIFSVVMYLQSEDAKLITDSYDEIPAILCDHKTISVTDEDGVFEDSKYVYYYGVSNPLLDVTESLYPATDDKGNEIADSKKLPQNLGKVQDLYNWELYGGREWVCLYTSKDPFVGIPILADSICFDSNMTKEGTVTVKGFELNNKYDFNNSFNTCFRSMENLKMIEDASKYKKNPLYIHYSFDLEAAGAVSGGESFIQSLATMVSTPSAWVLLTGMLAIGLGGGAAIGTLAERKKQAKKEEV